MKPNWCGNVKDAVNTGQKRHYIPEFYLKQWGNPSKNGRLYEYCRRYQGVVARPTYPGGTGYQPGLYTFSELDGEARNFLEDVFLGRADDAANDALQRLLMQDMNLKPELRVAWSRYIMTLLHLIPIDLTVSQQGRHGTALCAVELQSRLECGGAAKAIHPRLRNTSRR